jgi:serine/threonine protein kinase
VLQTPGIVDGRYRVDRHVGEGGFGDVFSGFHLALGVPVAIKVLRVHEALSVEQRDELVARFLDEGRVLTRLRHPNVVAALDLGLLSAELGGGRATPYLVMEWVEGQTLEEVLVARPTPFPLAEAWALFEPLAAALAHAHAAGVVHRDLKPANVMVLRDPAGNPVPRVIDFGVAKLMDPAEVVGQGWTETATRSPFTPAYAAPEQLTHSRTGPWTDVHALGLLFVELVTGAPPYGLRQNVGVAAVDPNRPTPRAAGVDVGAMEPVIARALALRPADRYANAGELLAAARDAFGRLASAPPAAATFTTGRVGTFAEDPSTVAPASHTVPHRPAPPSGVSRRAVLAGSAAIVLAAAAGVVVVPRFRAHETPKAPPLASPSAPASAHTAARSLESLTLVELADRVRRAGVTDPVNQNESGNGMRFRTVMWNHTAGGHGDTWNVQVAALSTYGAPATPTDDERRAAVSLAMQSYVATGYAGTYGVDATSIAVVETSAAGGADAMFEALFGDVPLLSRGTLAAPHPPGAPKEGDGGAPAKHLRELTADALAARLRAKGAVVSGVWAGTFDSATIGFLRGSAAGTAQLTRKDAKNVLAGYGYGHLAIAYAQDGETLVVVGGDASLTTKEFLGSVLAGLGATVAEQR